MAEEVVGFRLEVRGTDQQIKQLTRLTAQVDSLVKQRQSLTRAEKRGTVTARNANSQRAKLNINLKANRNALRDVEAQILKNNNALRKNSGFVAGVAKGTISAFKQVALATGLAFGVRGVVGAIGNAINIFKDFQQGAANLAAVLGKSRDEIKFLTDDAKRLGATTSFTASQVLELQVAFAKLGFSEEEIRDATEATLDLAAAAGVDLAEAARVAGSTIRAFGLDANETQRVVDVMAKSFSSSALDLEKFATAMRSVAPVAKNAGLELEEVTALLAILVDRGIDASTAGTGLRNVFLELSKQGLTFEEAMLKINTASDKNAVSLALFGKRGAVVGTILAENGKDADRLAKAFDNAGGAARRMAEEQLDTLSGSTIKLSSAWEGFILSLEDGEGAIAVTIRGILDVTRALLGFITSGGTATKIFETQSKAVEDLDKNITPLLGKYDELEKEIRSIVKTGDDASEQQAKLAGLARELGEVIPQAALAFNGLGEATQFSTDAARAFIKEQKEILKLDNTAAITEQEQAIEDLNDELVTTERRLENLIKLGSKNTAETKRLIAQINGEISTRKAKIAILSGELTASQIIAEQEKKANEERAKAATQDIKDSEALAKAEALQVVSLESLNNELKDLKKQRQGIDITSEGFIRLGFEIDVVKQKIKEAKNGIQGLSEEALDSLIEKFDELKEKIEITFGEETDLLSFFDDEDKERIIEDTDFVIAEFQRSLEGKKQLLDIALANEEISQLEHDVRIKALNQADFDRKKSLRQKEQQQTLAATSALFGSLASLAEADSEQQKGLASVQALVNTFLGATNVLTAKPALPFPANIIALAATITSGLAAVVRINTAEQGTILHAGGILSGNSHASGGIPARVGGKPIELEGGEAIINKKSTSAFKSVLSSINQAGGGVPFVSGGIPSFQAGAVPLPPLAGIVGQAVQVVQSDIEGIVEGIANAINTQQIVVVESDISQTQRTVELIESESEI